MTAQRLEDCGRSFLIVMDLFEDRPCDLKRHVDRTANGGEQCQYVIPSHDTSPPFRVCGRGNQKQQAFYVPRRLPEEARPPALAGRVAAPTTPPCFCHWQQSSLLQHLNTAEAARQVYRAADFAIRG